MTFTDNAAANLAQRDDLTPEAVAYIHAHVTGPLLTELERADLRLRQAIAHACETEDRMVELRRAHREDRDALTRLRSTIQQVHEQLSAWPCDDPLTRIDDAVAALAAARGI